MPTVLERAAGALCARAWPADLCPPPGCQRAPDGSLRAPLAQRARLRRMLQAANVPFVDLLAPPPLDLQERPACIEPAPLALSSWLRHGGHGALVGLGDGAQVDFVLAAVHHTGARALLLVRDSGAMLRWRAALRERPGTAAIDVVSVATAGRSLATSRPRHDLLVVVQPELMPAPTLASAQAGLATAHVLAFVDHATSDLLAVTTWAGPVLLFAARGEGAARVELRLPLGAEQRTAYEAAWHEFLCGYDAFAALRPDAGFGTFVAEARREPAWRPSLLAWHRARAIAAWNAAKAVACGELLARHRGQSVLVFTPDRGSAYELAREHLVAPVTAELPKGERAALLAAFARRELRVLVGPRLLELGVAAGTADVGIVAGGGFGRGDRRARFDRVGAHGVVYELVAEGTAEVGQARRFAAALGR
ncbi:MAG: hypothetical protein IT455_22365 [Planctomycetes bacterium]|nr:hypothetical protein [Planctomycetota bacterium]